MYVPIVLDKYLKVKYSTLPNKRTGSNKRTGGEICRKLISAQDLINAQGEKFVEN